MTRMPTRSPRPTKPRRVPPRPYVEASADESYARSRRPLEEERGLTEEDFLDEEDNSEDANLRTDDLEDEGPVSTNY